MFSPEQLTRNRRTTVLLLSILAAAMLWWMLGAYSTHGRSHYRPVRSRDSVAGLVTAPGSQPQD